MRTLEEQSLHALERLFWKNVFVYNENEHSAPMILWRKMIEERRKLADGKCQRIEEAKEDLIEHINQRR